MDCGGWMLTSAKVVAPVAAASHKRAVNKKSLSMVARVQGGERLRSDRCHSMMR